MATILVGLSRSVIGRCLAGLKHRFLDLKLNLMHLGFGVRFALAFCFHVFFPFMFGCLPATFGVTFGTIPDDRKRVYPPHPFPLPQRGRGMWGGAFRKYLWQCCHFEPRESGERRVVHVKHYVPPSINRVFVKSICPEVSNLAKIFHRLPKASVLQPCPTRALAAHRDQLATTARIIFWGS